MFLDFICFSQLQHPSLTGGAMFADLVALLSLVKQLDKWERFSCLGRSQNFPQAVDVAADKFGDREGLVVLQQNIKRNFAELKTEIEVTWTSWSRLSCQHCHPGFGCRTHWIGTQARGEAGHMGAKHSWMVFLHIIWTFIWKLTLEDLCHVISLISMSKVPDPVCCGQSWFDLGEYHIKSSAWLMTSSIVTQKNHHQQLDFLPWLIQNIHVSIDWTFM